MDYTQILLHQTIYIIANNLPTLVVLSIGTLLINKQLKILGIQINLYSSRLTSIELKIEQLSNRIRDLELAIAIRRVTKIDE